jgi:hypothetical protein
VLYCMQVVAEEQVKHQYGHKLHIFPDR